MKEKLYTIPVNDAFASSCECPICTMYKTLEDNSIEYTMGPSYMEDDVRSETDRLGFCDKHIKQVYHMDNRLGMAWVMKTHFDKTIDDVEKLQKKGAAKAVSLFKKNTEESPLLSYLHPAVFPTLAAAGFITPAMELPGFLPRLSLLLPQ